MSSRLIFAGLLLGIGSALIASSLYLYIIFHFGPNWSLFIIPILLFLAFITPAISYNYSPDDPSLLVPNHMSYEGFLICRDFGNMIAIALYFATYLIPLALWIRNDGLNPTQIATHLTFWFNAFCGYSFVMWYAIFVRREKSHY